LFRRLDFAEAQRSDFRSPGIYAWDAKRASTTGPNSPIRRLRRRIGEFGIAIWAAS
jgi:hypothetical protein